MIKRWIQKAIHKPGRLHKDLNIQKNQKIPMSLLNAIIKAKAGQIITNPTKIGKKKIKVTRKIEQRAIFAKNLKNISKKNKS